MLGFLGGLASGFMNLIGGKSAQDKSAETQMAINEQNVALQREFAQNGIQWKVDDARRAGIHPLAALGAPTTSFSNLVGPTVGQEGEGIQKAGQDIGRAMSAASSMDTKYDEAVKKITIQKGELENALLASQIAKTNAPSVGPSMPTANQRWLVDGQGQTAIPMPSPNPLIKEGPMKRTVSDPGNPVIEPGAVADVGFSRTKDGYAPVPSSDVMGKMSNDMPGIIMWNLRNRVLPSIGLNQTPPNVPVPKGYEYWNYDPITQSYRPDRSVWKHPGDFFGDYFKGRR